MDRSQKNICLKFPKNYLYSDSEYNTDTDSEYNPETDSDYNSDTEYISDCDEAILKPRKKTNRKDILHDDILSDDILSDDINFVDKCNNLLLSMVGLTMFGIFILVAAY